MGAAGRPAGGSRSLNARRPSEHQPVKKPARSVVFSKPLAQEFQARLVSDFVATVMQMELAAIG